MSHARTDLAWAEWISWQLEEAGYRVVMQAWDFVVGSNFVHEMHRAASTSTRTVAVLSAAYLISAWAEAEWLAAWASDPTGVGRKLVIVRVEDCPQPGLLGQVVGVDLFALDEQVARNQLLAAVAAARRKPARAPGFPGIDPYAPRFPGFSGAWGAEWDQGRSPFPGLASFDSGRALVFKGRDEETLRLTTRLAASPTSYPNGLMVVVGPSGCGKSSLVAAGVAPKLAADPRWLVAPPMMPGGQPVAALAGVLTATARQQGLNWRPDALSEILLETGAKHGVVQELLAAAAPARRLLVVVDQVEELLARSSPASRAQFLALLADMCAGSARVRVVATLRSEYLDDLIKASASVGLAIQAEVVAPISRDLLPTVITEPAEMAGLVVDGDLVARMVTDTGDGQALPLLAYTLQRLEFAARDAGTAVLTQATYEEIGGVRGALVDHAEAALANAATITGRGDAEVLDGLLRLVDLDVDGRPIRRRIALDQLPASTRGQLAPFVARRLLVVDAVPGGPATVEVAHEHLLVSWPPLVHAIARAADRLRERARAERAAEDWVRDGRSPGRLWSLSHATAALTTVNADEFTPTARNFLRIGQRRGRRRLTAVFTVLSVFLVSAVVAAVVAIERQQTAREAQNEAEAAQRTAAARALVAAADAAREHDPPTAMRLGTAAYGAFPGNETAASLVSTLSTTRYAGSLPRADATDAVWFADFFPDGHTLVILSDQGVELWDTTDRRSLRRVGQPLLDTAGSVSEVALSPDGRTLATVGDDVPLYLWDVTDRDSPRRLGDPVAGTNDAVSEVGFSPDGRTLAAGNDEGVQLWDVTDRAAPRRLGQLAEGSTKPTGVFSFSPAGQTLAVACRESTVILWDIADLSTPQRLGQPLVGTADYVSHLAFSPDGRTLAAGGNNTTIDMWDMTDRVAAHRLGEPLDGAESISTLAFAPDGRIFFSAAGDDPIILWDMAEPAAPRRLDQTLAGAGSVSSMALDPESDTLVTTSSEGAVMFWDMTADSSAHRLGAPFAGGALISSSAFSQVSRVLMSAGFDDSVHLWDVTDLAAPRHLGQTPSGQPEAVRSAAYSRDGKTLATGGVEGTVILWDLADPTEPRPLGTPLTGHTPPFYFPLLAMAFSPDGRTLAVGSGETVVLWDVSNRSEARGLGQPLTAAGTVLSVAFSADGRTLVAGDSDHSVSLWDLSDLSAPQRLGEPLSGHTNSVWSVVFAADGQTLATASADGTVVLWDISEPAAPRRLGQPIPAVGVVSSVATSPDSRTLALVTDREKVELWDLTDRSTARRLGQPLVAGAGPILSLAFSPDNETLAVGGDRVVLWGLADLNRLRGDPLGYACARGGADLDSDTWSFYAPGIPPPAHLC